MSAPLAERVKRPPVNKVTLEGMEGTQFAVACNDMANAERNITTMMPRRAPQLSGVTKDIVKKMQVVQKAIRDDDSAVLHEKHAHALLGVMEQSLKLCQGIIDRKDTQEDVTPDNRHLGFMSNLMSRTLLFSGILEKMFPEQTPEAGRVQEIKNFSEQMMVYNPRQLRTSKIIVPGTLCDRLDVLCESFEQQHSVAAASRG